MRLIEESTSTWLSGGMLLAGGAAAILVGDIYLKSLGVVSIIAGPLFIYLDWRMSKDFAENEHGEIEISVSDASNEEEINCRSL